MVKAQSYTDAFRGGKSGTEIEGASRSGASALWITADFAGAIGRDTRHEPHRDSAVEPTAGPLMRRSSGSVMIWDSQPLRLIRRGSGQDKFDSSRRYKVGARAIRGHANVESMFPGVSIHRHELESSRI